MPVLSQHARRPARSLTEEEGENADTITTVMRMAWLIQKRRGRGRQAEAGGGRWRQVEAGVGRCGQVLLQLPRSNIHHLERFRALSGI